MTINFRYDPSYEYENFRAAFGSKNHAQASPRQVLFFEHYAELTRPNAIAFSEWYLREHNIDPNKVLSDIEANWIAIETKYFTRANAIFGKPLPMDRLTVYLTVHDRCSYNYERGYFFIHTNLKAVTKTLMHELWHWYYYAFFRDEIQVKHGAKVSNDMKEALTVLLNEEFSDLMPGIQDIGYPQHQELRATILKEYRNTHDIKQTIERSLQSITE